MSEFDDVAGVSAEELAVRTEEVRVEAIRRSMTRAEAIAQGEAQARAAAFKKGETGQALDQRIARGKAYAAWEWDGKPAGGAHLEEFGVTSPSAPPSVRNGSDLKPEGRKR